MYSQNVCKQLLLSVTLMLKAMIVPPVLTEASGEIHSYLCAHFMMVAKGQRPAAFCAPD